MLRTFLLIVSIFLITNNLIAQSDCPCCTQFHKQFDFWVGDWEVYDKLGNIVGENLIVKLENNCILNEHWQGAKGGSGRSYNYFDTTDSTWNQLWIDSRGSNLVLKGRLFGNQMILISDLIQEKKVDWYKNRITWTNNSDGTVTQLWEILDKEENVLNTVFIGIYKRKNSLSE